MFIASPLVPRTVGNYLPNERFIDLSEPVSHGFKRDLGCSGRSFGKERVHPSGLVLGHLGSPRGTCAARDGGTVSRRVRFLGAGKSHVRRAVALHEESVREASLCKKLRNIEVLQEVLSAAHRRSQLKDAQLQEDDDLLDLIEAPDIVCE